MESVEVDDEWDREGAADAHREGATTVVGAGGGASTKVMVVRVMSTFSGLRPSDNESPEEKEPRLGNI